MVVKDMEHVEAEGVPVEPRMGCEWVAGCSKVPRELPIREDSRPPTRVLLEVIVRRVARVGVAEGAHLVGVVVPEAE
eukprot:3719147-Alexandrium_andersonii.AAC.1